MSSLSPVRKVAVILAGGRSTRMGGRDKALVTLAGNTLLELGIRALQSQVDEVLINSNVDADRFSNLGLTVIPDFFSGHLGPLAGIHAALRHAPEARVLSVAVDLAWLPDDLVARLEGGLGTARCAYATNGEQHALALLWEPGSVTLLEEYLASGERSIKRFLADHGQPVVFDRQQDQGLFVNINTPADLARAGELRNTVAGRL